MCAVAYLRFCASGRDARCQCGITSFTRVPISRVPLAALQWGAARRWPRAAEKAPELMRVTLACGVPVECGALRAAPVSNRKFTDVMHENGRAPATMTAAPPGAALLREAVLHSQRRRSTACTFNLKPVMLNAPAVRGRQ
jgi:hypothetical protein